MIIELFNTGYVCGGLVGGGAIQADPKVKRYSLFVESRNKEFIGLFGQRLDVLFELASKRYERKKADLNLFSVVCYNKEKILEFTSKFRFKHGAYEWTVPQQCYEDKHFRKGFLQGYFDAKAKIRVRYRKRQKKGQSVRFDKVRAIKVSSVNLKGLSEIKVLLESFGVGSTISKSNGNNILDIEGKRRISSFRDRIGFGLAGKRAELERALEMKSGL